MSIFTRFLGRFFGGRPRREVEQSLSMIRMGTALRLTKRYAAAHGDTASPLAAAVTNELFGLPPTNEAGRQFAASHGELIDRSLVALKSDPDICYIVSLASHTEANIAGNTSTLTGDMISTWDRLQRAGIMLPIDQISMPASLEELRATASDYLYSA